MLFIIAFSFFSPAHFFKKITVPDDRARPARLADLFKTRFGRDNKGLGSEIITLLEDDGTGGGAADDKEAELFGDLGDEEAPRERIGGSSGSAGPSAPAASSSTPPAPMAEVYVKKLVRLGSTVTDALNT